MIVACILFIVIFSAFLGSMITTFYWCSHYSKPVLKVISKNETKYSIGDKILFNWYSRGLPGQYEENVGIIKKIIFDKDGVWYGCGSKESFDPEETIPSWNCKCNIIRKV